MLGRRAWLSLMAGGAVAAAKRSVEARIHPPTADPRLRHIVVLRGYANYRFRAPNLIASEISYERKLWDPLGVRIFGELGRVGLRPGDLGCEGLKSSVGVSLTFRLGGASVAEISFGWSGAEGLHSYGTGNTNNVGGVTAGLRGVF